MATNDLKLTLSANSTKKDENKFKDESYKYVCALLNSNGGTLTLNTKMNRDDIIRPIEQNLKMYIGTDISDNLSVCGDMSEGQYVLKVKGYQQLCTMNYNAFLPSDTQVFCVIQHEFEKIKKILDVNRIVDITDVDHNVPTEFIRHHSIGIQESKTVQFKCVQPAESGKPNTDLASRLFNNKLNRYISAFANYRGGRLYCGVKDDGIVEGQIVNDEDKESLIGSIGEYINKMIWPEHIARPKRGRNNQWDISFQPVTDRDGVQLPSRYVVVISVPVCQGGVFCLEPESYHIVDGKVKKMAFKEWKKGLLYPKKRGTQIVSKVPRCEWSNEELRNECDSLDGRMLRMINNGKWDKFKKLAAELETISTSNPELDLVVLSKWSMFYYRKNMFKEAKSYLDTLGERLRKAEDILIFDVRKMLVLSALERSSGNHEESYDIAKGLLAKVDKIAPSILTAEFYVHFATMLTIIESNKDLNKKLKKDLTTGSFKNEAISFYDKSLQHLENADYVPQSKVDMLQKAYINLAVLRLGCSLSGDVADSHVCKEDIIEASTCLKRASELDIDSASMTGFRSCHNIFAKSFLLYRKGQIHPSREERIELLESAIQKAKEAEAYADGYDFKELSAYASRHAQVFKEELEKLTMNRE